MVRIVLVATAIAVVLSSNLFGDDKDKAMVPVLLNQLKSRKPSDRKAALEGLATIGPGERQAIGQQVAEAMLDPVADVAYCARDTLEKVDPAVAKECTTLLVDASLSGRSLALRNIQKLKLEGRSAAPILLRIMLHPKGDPLGNLGKSEHVYYPRLRSPYMGNVIRTLGDIAPDNEKIPDVLALCCKSNCIDVRHAAVDVLPKLSKIGNEKNAIILLAVILRSDPDTAVRCSAAASLAALGSTDETAIAALKQAAADRDASVRSAAANALARMGKS